MEHSWPPLFICRTKLDTVDIQEARTARELMARRPDILEAYKLTSSQERELSAAWYQYWDAVEAEEPTATEVTRARVLLEAIVRNVFKRAKENTLNSDLAK